MRAMKNSGIEWIGEIPQDWGLRKIKTNFDIIAGATPKSGEASFWDGDIPWITPADYTTEGVYVSAGHKSITQDGLNSCATSLIPEGSIIFPNVLPWGLWPLTATLSAPIKVAYPASRKIRLMRNTIIMS